MCEVRQRFIRAEKLRAYHRSLFWATVGAMAIDLILWAVIAVGLLAYVRLFFL